MDYSADEFFAVPAAEPRVKVVYNREDFTKIPFLEHVAGYPEVRYMGSKHRLLPLLFAIDGQGSNRQPRLK